MGGNLRKRGKYALLAADSELKKQLKARNCLPRDEGPLDREVLLGRLADYLRTHDHDPIITSCKLSKLHCLVITNSMKPTTMIWGFHGAYSSAWSFMQFSQLLCWNASMKRKGICIVLPFGMFESHDSNIELNAKRGPHLWLPQRDQYSNERGTHRQSPSRKARFMEFLKDPSKLLKDNEYQKGDTDYVIQQVQISLDIACSHLKIKDNRIALVGYDQGAVVVQEMALRLRTPPMLVALWSTNANSNFLEQANIDGWPQDVRTYRTKSTQFLICHGEQDGVSPPKDIYQFRGLLNDYGYKTVCFTHSHGHDVPHSVPKVTINTLFERIDRMEERIIVPPLSQQNVCAIIPRVSGVPEKSDELSVGYICTVQRNTLYNPATTHKQQPKESKTVPNKDTNRGVITAAPTTNPTTANIRLIDNKDTKVTGKKNPQNDRKMNHQNIPTLTRISEGPVPTYLEGTALKEAEKRRKSLNNINTGLPHIHPEIPSQSQPAKKHHMADIYGSTDESKFVLSVDLKLADQDSRYGTLTNGLSVHDDPKLFDFTTGISIWDPSGFLKDRDKV